MKNGFKKSRSEPTLYVKINGTEVLIVSLYVDDLVITGSNDQLIQDFKDDMMLKTYEMNDFGLLHYFLGIKIHQGAGGIFISQR